MKRLFLIICIFSLIPVFSVAASYRSIEVDDDATYVNMGRVVVSDWNGFYAFLDQLKNLEKVDMFSTQVWKNRIDEMHERYPNVEFGWTMRFAEHSVRTDMTAFSTLHGSSSTTHNANDIGLVRYCRNLKALDFGHNGVKDISFLYELPELRVLIMACNRLEDITPVASLKHLEYLEIFSNHISDLTPLIGLEHLVDLNMGFNEISDLTPLYEMKQLKRLWMYNCIDRSKKIPVSDEQLAMLHEALPECEINISSNPSEGGWRVHSHYDTIFRMFRSGVYEPFDDSAP